MILNIAMSTNKNLSKCSGTNRAEVEIPLWHLPSRVHLGVIISIINIPNLTSVPGRVQLVGIIGYFSNFWVFSKILLIPARRCRILVSWSSTSQKKTKQHVSSTDNSHSTRTTTLNRGHLWYLQKTRPSANYAKDWLDQLFPIPGLVWRGKGYHLWMWSTSESEKPFPCVLGHFRHGDEQATNRVILVQACSWSVRRQSFAISE